MLTPSMEDYLEKIFFLIEKKGYARPIDIASSLQITPSSVTRMIQKLDEMGFIIYEKYRGIIFTDKGKKIARTMAKKHKMLEEFFRTIGVQEENIYQEVEGIEHHISQQTAFCISSLLHFFQENPSIMNAYLRYSKSHLEQK